MTTVAPRAITSAMQKDSKLFEDLATMAYGAAGALMDVKREIESMVAAACDRLLLKERFVTREEFEVVKSMAQKAREENERLRESLEALRGDSSAPPRRD